MSREAPVIMAVFGRDRLLCCLLGLYPHGAQESAAEKNIETGAPPWFLF